MKSMKDREKKISDAAQVYVREYQLLERIRNIQNNPDLLKEDFKKHYAELGKEYAKLLKQTIKITRIGDSNQRKLLYANEQIEKQKEELGVAYKKLELVARTDPLTRLSNRRDFLEKFKHEVNRFERGKSPFSVVVGDVDDFKQVNDRYGHDCGDYVLLTISNILRTNTRKLDIIARWGGEEFILLLPGTSLVGAVKVAEAIRGKIAVEPYCYMGHQLAVTMSFGVCQYEPELSLDECIKIADEAMYEGKHSGKNRVVMKPLIKEQ
jgi:diguanylate cyclase (GGDEF)-like protein